jgi:hypothetical protein
MASVDSRLIDTSQMAREGSAIFIRSQQVRDPLPGGAHNPLLYPLGIASVVLHELVPLENFLDTLLPNQ